MADDSIIFLSEIDTENTNHQVYWLPSIPNNEAALDALGVGVPSKDQYANFLEANKSGSGITAMIDKRFEPIVMKYDPTRFSDGSINVLYSSLEGYTAKAEVEFHKKEDNFGDRVIHKTMIGIDFDGETKDLRNKKSEWKDLTSDDWKFCQRLGREATDIGLGGLLTPSARFASGTNLPIFRRDAIKGFEELEPIEFPSS